MGFEIFSKSKDNQLFKPQNPDGDGFAIFAPPPPKGSHVPRSVLDDREKMLEPALPQPGPKANSFLDTIFDNPISRGIDAFQEKGASMLTFGLTDKWNRKLENDLASKGMELPKVDFNGTAEKIGGGLGTFAGSVLPIGGAYKLTGGIAGKLLPNAPKYLDRFIRGSLAGEAYGLADQGMDAAFDTKNNGDQNIGERLGSVANDGLLFGAADAALYGAGKGIKKVADSTGLTEWVSSAFKNVASRLGKTETAASLEPSLPQLSRGQVNSSLRISDPKQTAMQEFEQGVEKVRNFIKHDDILAAYPEGTPIESALADIKQNTGVDLLGLLQKVETLSSKPLTTQLTQKADISRLGRVAGALEPKPFNPTRPIAEKAIQSAKDEAAATAENLLPNAPYDLKNWKDISGFKGYMTDVYRNLKDASGKDFDKVKANLLDPFDAAKKANVQMQEEILTDLKKNIVDKFGINKGSKESALVQMYGEKEITLDELKKRAPNKWQDIVEADKWFRNKYDTLLDQVNASRQKIYPNNPEKIVPKRNDYYRHFNELTQLSGLKNLFDTPSAIDPSLVGVSEFTKPNSKFAGFMQKRGMGPYKRDAVGGFLEYTPAASYSVHIDPQIKSFKELSKDIAAGTEESKHLNNLINFLQKYTQDLAGKTNPADRFFQEVVPGGRTTMAALHWLNNRVKANTILGNVGSTLAQLANIPNGIAFAKQYSVKGAGRALASIVRPDEAMAQSGFLKERFAGAMYRQFDTRMIEQPRKLAEWMMETSDRLGTSFVWNSAYAKGLAQKVADPVKYADDATRSLIAGRGIGEVPLLQKSKLFQLVAPFQLEVANLWRVQKDFVKEKDFGALATLYLGAFVFNRAMEKVKGSGVMFDPIQAIREAMADDLTPLERGGRLAGEVLSNIPLGQSAVSMFYPEYGTEILGAKLPTREKLFGDNDPTRFGEGLTIAKGMQDPLYKILLPFGGGQLKKTLQGVSAVRDEGAYQKNYANDFLTGGKLGSNQLKYPIDITPGKAAQALLLGPNATSEAQEYYKEDRRPLSEKQTELYKMAKDKKGLYNYLMNEREYNTFKSKVNDIAKDPELTDDEKREKIAREIERIRKLQNK